MTKLTIRKLVGIGLLVAVFLFAIGIVGSMAQAKQQPSGAIALQAPPFINIAHAEGSAINNFADDEAGIAAYFNANMTINLNDVDQLYRTIEEQTATYILGSLPLTDYDEDHDVHVYISTDGWVMAYYRDTEPTSKIFDWRHYDGSANLPNKLALGLDIVAAQIGAIANPSYYHFRYPNATDMMLIAEWLDYSGTDSFDANIPSALSYYERSWSLAKNTGRTARYSTYYLNGTEIGTTSGGTHVWEYREGVLAASQLPPDTVHTISIELEQWFNTDTGAGGLALVYRVP
ncbi:MAG: hypothetical protein IPH82_02475 [Chloroflexi bacterium]|nr:hypothetical protein [Chloroflexota bacterium]MBK7917877.1 hypothetical protein [Chloroflexota bacterium]